MPSVDAVIARARSMLHLPERTVYWAGAGGHRADTPTAAEILDVGRQWPRLDAATQARLRPIALAAGLDVDDPTLKVPACDCSGFVCWALGFARRTAPDTFTSPDGWIFTDSIHADAIGPRHRFRRIERAVRGALVVYPKPPNESFGHVAFVTAVDDQGRATRVLHCSAGNFMHPPFDAVQENAPTAFEEQPRSVYAWCSLVTPE